MYLSFNRYCCYYLFNIISFILVMRIIHEPLVRILRATSIPRNDVNEVIDLIFLVACLKCRFSIVFFFQ